MGQSFFLVPFLAKSQEQKTTENVDKEKQFKGSTLTMDTNLSQ